MNFPLDDLIPGGCRSTTAVVGAVGYAFLVAAIVLAATKGLDLSAWLNNGALRAATGPGPATSAIPGLATQRTGPIDNPIPKISKEFFSSGQVEATVSGGFVLHVSPRLDKEKAYSDGDLAWITYGKGNPTVLVSFGEDENSVAVSDGTNTALGVDDQCAFDVHVNGLTVTGHIECDAGKWLRGAEVMGTTNIVVDFAATGAP
ncbi:MAG TPA: hypothetical protein VJ850_01300 [Candidatus Limnocylindrales bacterium]|nr:hypothetical protein [Candidatus Limnocylindrales bacterium]